MRDITERKLAEIKLKNSENKYRHLFSNSPFSIILVNAKGNVVDCNPAIEQLLGYKRDEIIDKRFDKLSLIHPKYLLMLLEGLKDAQKGGGDTYTIMDAMLNKKDHTSIWANVQSSQVEISKACWNTSIAYSNFPCFVYVIASCLYVLEFLLSMA